MGINRVLALSRSVRPQRDRGCSERFARSDLVLKIQNVPWPLRRPEWREVVGGDGRAPPRPAWSTPRGRCSELSARLRGRHRRTCQPEKGHPGGRQGRDRGRVPCRIFAPGTTLRPVGKLQGHADFRSTSGTSPKSSELAVDEPGHLGGLPVAGVADAGIRPEGGTG